jgi:hypothetical protein
MLICKRTYRLDGRPYTISVYWAGKDFVASWECIECVGVQDEISATVESAIAAAEDSIGKHHAEYHTDK